MNSFDISDNSDDDIENYLKDNDDNNSDDSIDDMFWYDDRHIWIENNDYQMLEN